MPFHLHSPGRRRQQGVATLTVALLLLFVASLATLYVNRGVLVEQRSSAVQMQSSQTLEAAEAAVEWATGMLNSTYFIGPDCKPTTVGTDKRTFRERYALTKAHDAASPTTDVFPSTLNPGCKVDPATGALTCNCPTNGEAALGSAEQPGFTLAFEAVPDPSNPAVNLADAIKVTAWACAAQSGACKPYDAVKKDGYDTAEGHQRVTAMLKMGPAPRIPSAPLTCGTSCLVSGSFNIINKDVATNGVLINAGTTITVQGGAEKGLESLEGQPVANAQIANDQSLLNLSSKDPTCDKSAMFMAYFSMSIEQFRDATTTTRISCSSAADCKSKLDKAIAEGDTSFYFDTDLQLSGNNTYGTRMRPITIVTPNAIKINGDNTFYGLIFSNSADWNDIGTGSATIYGAQVTCAAYNTNGNGTLEYDAEALKNTRRTNAPLVRVPGSWRDFMLDSDAKK
jgi:Tfp pilus assembly protein PilX